MSWLGLGRRRPATDELPAPAWQKALSAAVVNLPGADAIADYVLTGRDPAPLAALTSANGIRYVEWYPDCRSGKVDSAALRRLYAGFDDLDATVLRRWGQVLGALSPSSGWGAPFSPVPGAEWVDVVLTHVIAATPDSEHLPLSFPAIARAVAVDGVGTRDLVTAITTGRPDSRFSRRHTVATISRLPGLADALHEHTDVVVAVLTSGDVEARLATLALVDTTLDDDRLALITPALARAAASTSTQVRERAEPVLARVPGATAALRTIAVEGDPGSRGNALALLARLPDQRAWARETALADRAASVRRLADRWDDSAPDTDDELTLPPLVPVAWAVPRDAAAAVAHRFATTLSTRVAEHNRRIAGLDPNIRWGLGPYPPLRPELESALLELLVADAPPTSPPHLGVDNWLARTLLRELCEQEAPDAATVLKLATAIDLDDPRPGRDVTIGVLEWLHARDGVPDLRTAAAALDATGADGFALVWASYARRNGRRLGRRWDAADVWPFVAEHLDRILSDRANGWDVDDVAPLTALSTLPHLPARVVDHLAALALGSRTTMHVPAQDALAGTPGVAARAAAGLLDGKADTRLAAAQWLTRLADPTTLPALQTAWARERQDVVRGALLDALLTLGEDAATYLDPQQTARTAAKALAKGLPPTLAWCDWDTLPETTWAADGTPVPREVVQWLCTTAVRAKSPAPDAVLRHYATLIDRTGRERLAHALLTAWIHADLAPASPAEAEETARQEALATHRGRTRADGPYPGLTVEELAAALLPQHLRTPVGSAITSKGVLAVVAACGGRDVVPPAERYLREWYGQRAGQGKALITMLAWVDDPSATQLVLAISARFRTRSFQDAAAAEAVALAERKGWTVDELADRTIPTGGFDDDGVLPLPYGTRTFTAHLLPDLTITLRDPDGATVRTLPAPRRTDDPEQVATAKKTLTTARREVKTIAKLQRERLYEALCTERSWAASDWQEHLQTHPVVGPALRRLVWVATDHDAPPVVFRPLDDGTLTDADDAPVTLAPTARVRLAHDSLLTPEQVTAWQTHLADYEVAPLFHQLGRGLHVVDPQALARDELTDFQGHLLGAFALRSRAARLGYTRGPTEDGGWFSTYTKRFPTLGLTAVVDHSGNPLPEEDRTLALTGLRFVRTAPDGAESRIPVGDVPAVLVSECWHDVREMAAAGTGYDPDWAKKVEY